jgi:LacI family transcriptional regulator
MVKSTRGPSSGKRQAARQSEVAKRAGVSTATVSRLLNGKGIVSESLRARIESAVNDLDYVPHWAARTLVSRESRTIGAIVPTLDLSIFTAGIEALQERLHEHRYTLLLASYQYRLSQEVELARSFIERGVDGLVLVGNEHDEALYRLAANADLSIVNTYAFARDAAHPCIGFDNREAAARIVRLLVDLGHREFGLITNSHVGNDRVAARLEGMRAALADAAIDLPGDAVLEIDYSIDDARRAFAELIVRRPTVTAVACTNDAHAIGVLLEAAKLGIDVPCQLSVTGFDDIALARQISPALTTVHVPAAELGRRAADFIVARRAGVQGIHATSLTLDLVARESHAPPRSR